MMRAAREWRRGGMANKGGKNRKMKGKSGTNRPQAELEAAELAKPWVNDVIRPEILKKHKLHAEARASKDVKDWEAFKEQKKKVAVMVNEAKLEYIGSHPEEVTDDEESFDADSSFGGNDEEDCADSSFEEESTDTGYEENGSSQEEWQWTPDSYYNYSQSSLEGSELNESATASSSTNLYQNSSESYESYDSSQDQSQDGYSSYEGHDGYEGYDNYEGYEGYGYYEGYGWNDPASQSYYNSSTPQPQQYYGSSNQNTMHNQWYNHQSYEQSHSSFQQYAVPYQQKNTAYSNSSFGSISQSRDQKNRSYNTPNANFNKQQGYRRKDEPLTLFYCESCDRSFPTDEKLKEHLSEHKVCGREGCKFTAHAKVVEKHIRLQHDTGLYRRIKSSGDSEKWRAERKKKFPSKENIEARQKQQQEMLSRGERLGFDQNRFQNSRGRGSFGGRGRGRHNNSNMPPRNLAMKQEPGEDGPHPPRPWRPQFPVPVIEDIELCTRGKLAKFLGTECYKSEKEKVQETMSACGALNTLCDYGGAESSDEDDSLDNVEERQPSITKVVGQGKSEEAADLAEPTEAVEKSEVKEQTVKAMSEAGEKEVSTPESKPNPQIISENNDYESDGSCPEEVPILKEVADNTEASTSPPTNEAKKRKLEDSEPSEDKNQHKHKKIHNEASDAKFKGNFRQRGKENNSFHRGKRMPRRPPTLLEKLLAPDIQHERNVILQCVRYVVEQKFFNVSQKTSEAQAPPAN